MEQLLRFEVFEQQRLRVRLFKHVKNAAQLIQLSKMQTLNSCLVNAAAVVDVFHVHVAANMALHNYSRKCMKTQSFYQELLFSLDCSTQMQVAFANFGLKDSTTSLLLVQLNTDDDEMKSTADKIVGIEAPLDELRDLYCHQTLQSVFKLDDEDLRAEHEELLGSIVSRVAGKECMRSSS